MPTDTERLDFLQRQHWTRWVGFDVQNGRIQTTWPVFAGDDLRAHIDRAIACRDAVDPRDTLDIIRKP